jgi:hypothetical protein
VTTWTGRIVPSLGQEIGLQQLPDGRYRYVLRDPPAEGQEAPTKPPSHDPRNQVNPGGHP